MRRSVLAIAATMVAAGFTLPLGAQKTTQVHPGTGGSPHVRTDWTVHGANISISYGRPFLKGRTIGKDVATYGEEWRIGADEATMLTTDKPLKFGTLALAPGTYTLFALPNATEWQLIVSKNGGPTQWGIPYPKGQDLGRVPMKIGKPAAPVEQVTIGIDATASGGTLRVEWGTASASVPFTVG